MNYSTEGGKSQAELDKNRARYARSVKRVFYNVLLEIFIAKLLYHKEGKNQYNAVKIKNSIFFEKVLDKVQIWCYTFSILIFKGYDEDGFYKEFSQRVGDGAIPILPDRNPITSELGVPKDYSE